MIEDLLQLKTFKTVDEVIAFLESKGGHLCGSRGLVKNNPSFVPLEDSDYDFCLTYSIDMYNMLIDYGFHDTATMPEYFDDEARAILEITTSTVPVQVVLRRDAEFYMEVYNAIPSNVYISYLWKRSASCDRELIQPLFNLMFALKRG